MSYSGLWSCSGSFRAESGVTDPLGVETGTGRQDDDGPASVTVAAVAVLVFCGHRGLLVYASNAGGLAVPCVFVAGCCSSFSLDRGSGPCHRRVPA